MFQKCNQILSQVGSMTAYKLSLNQNSSMKTSSMELNFLKNKASDFNSEVSTSSGKITMPNLCAATGTTGNDCNNLVLTTQVIQAFSASNLLCSFTFYLIHRCLPCQLLYLAKPMQCLLEVLKL